MVGAGDAYYKGKRMSAAEALARAGLAPLVPFAADDAALVSTNAYSAGQAALLVYDTQLVLDWADLNYAIDLQGMNSSVTPISTPVQDMRPFPWVNKTAARVHAHDRGQLPVRGRPRTGSSRTPRACARPASATPAPGRPGTG